MRRAARRAAGLLAVGLIALSLAGCLVGPNYEVPEPVGPDLWHQDLVRGLGSGEAALQTWWTLLEDPILTSIVARAAEANLDIRTAVARVDEARAARGIARGQWFPSIFAGAGYEYRQLAPAAFGGGGLPGVGEPQNFGSLGVDGSWELDFFGRIRRSVESASASLEGSIEDYRDVLVSIFAEVGLNYVDARTFQQRVAFAERNAANQRETLQLVRDRNAAGLVGDLDVRQAEQNLATTEALIPTLRIGLAQAIHRLGVLIGQPPDALYAELAPPRDIPEPPADVLVGLPRDLLRQRPDVRRAERDLAAQHAQIGVATAELYPKFSLLGQFAFQTIDAARFFSGDATAFSIGPAVQWNLFDGGRARSNIHVQEARTEALARTYEQTVLAAYEDVENFLVAFSQEQERRDSLQRSADASAAAVELVKTLYRTGLTDFQNVLDTERTLFQQEDALADSEGLVVGNLINLYRALGGGWAP